MDHPVDQLQLRPRTLKPVGSYWTSNFLSIVFFPFRNKPGVYGVFFKFFS